MKPSRHESGTADSNNDGVCGPGTSNRDPARCTAAAVSVVRIHQACARATSRRTPESSGWNAVACDSAIRRPGRTGATLSVRGRSIWTGPRISTVKRPIRPPAPGVPSSSSRANSAATGPPCSKAVLHGLPDCNVGQKTFRPSGPTARVKQGPDGRSVVVRGPQLQRQCRRYANDEVQLRQPT